MAFYISKHLKFHLRILNNLHLSSKKDCLLSESGTEFYLKCTVKILKIGTPEIITIIVLQLEQLDFTVQYCVQKMPTG